MGLRSARAFFGATAIVLASGCSLISSFDDYVGDAASTLPEGGGGTDAPGGGDVITPGDSGRDTSTPNDGAAPIECPSAPDPALLVHYMFEDAPGSKTVKDCSGKGNHGAIEGTVTFATGKVGGGLRFNGTTGCIDIGQTKGTGLTAFTVAAWINVVDYADGVTARYVAARTTDADERGWRFGTEPGGAIGAKIGKTPPPPPLIIVSPAGSPTGTWLHVGMVYAAGSDVELWIDGSKKATTPAAPAIVEDNSAHLRVGCFASGFGQNFHFSGTLDEVYVYSRALDDTEMAAATKP